MTTRFSTPLEKTEIHHVESIDDAFEFLRWLSQPREILAVDIETTGFDWWRDTIRAVQFGDYDTAWFVPFEDWRKLVKDALDSYTGPMVGHNFTFDLRFLTHHLGWSPSRWQWANLHDTQTMAFIHHSDQRKALKHLSGKYISARAVAGQQMLDDDMKRGGWDWATVPIDLPSYVFYSGLDVLLCARLWKFFMDSGEIVPDVYQMEMQLEGILMNMMMRGMPIDLEYCHAKKFELDQRGEELLDEIQTIHGVKKPNARQQILKCLLDDGVELTERTDSGQLSVSKDVLATLDHPLAQRLTEYRNVTKWSAAYFGNFIERYRPETGTVHPNIMQHAAKTGRMSVKDPAMQTLPRGRLVRDAVAARPGHKILAADFSSVEARLFAHFAREEGMMEAIKAGVDLHWYTARKAYQLSESAPVDPDRRQVAKNTTFCTIYGGGPKKVAETAGIAVADAESFVSMYHDAFPGVRRHQDEVINAGRRRARNGEGCYVETHMGNKLYTDDPDFAYRLGNFEIQGSARLVMARAIVDLDSVGLMDHAFMTVHDEVDLEVPEEDVEEAQHLLAETMQDHDTFRVPIDADVSDPGDRWGECK